MEAGLERGKGGWERGKRRGKGRGGDVRATPTGHVDASTEGGWETGNGEGQEGKRGGAGGDVAERLEIPTGSMLTTRRQYADDTRTTRDTVDDTRTTRDTVDDTRHAEPHVGETPATVDDTTTTGDTVLEQLEIPTGNARDSIDAELEQFPPQDLR
jgi:hypothetical protein